MLLIDKPKGWTSFDVVAKVRNTLQKDAGHKVKVGHTGTLDPEATGLLVLTIGGYCKRAQEFSKLDKVYEVEMELGKTSTTDDAEGEVTETNARIPNEKAIQGAISSFQGEIQQTPPKFSAIKVDGKRAYKLAREGKEVELQPRKITIYSIENVQITGAKARFTCKVSSGTYIRSLVRDIGAKLGCGAYMTDLRRASVGEFELKDAHKIDSIDQAATKIIET